MTTREAFILAKTQLSEHEARILFEELFGLNRLAMAEKADCRFGTDDEERLKEAVRKRAEGMPLQYILGKWTFMDNDYYVGEGVLIPRDDTEVAVRTCMDALKGIKSPKIIDLCSGSGIIAITLAKNIPDADITAVEKEPQAFAYLEKNIRFHKLANVRAVRGDIFLCSGDFPDGYFDAVISNPPYIRESEIHTLQKEVQFEPETALNGGEDGLVFYRCIAKHWTRKLKQGGTLTLEIGEEQAQDVSSMLKNCGMKNLKTIRDIQNLDRVIFCTE